MDDKLLVLAEIVGKLRKQVKELSQNTAEVKKLEGPQGPKGEKGDAGRDGKPGKDGKDGLSGKDGRDGANGKDGKDGVSVTDANIAADGSLVITLSDGSEVDAGPILTDVRASVIHNLSSSGGTASEPSISLTAAENLQEGDFVGINALGQATKASGAGGGTPSIGFVKSSYSSGQQATVFYSGLNDKLSGLLTGSRYYLSSTVAGSVTSVPVAGTGTIHQFLGYAVSTTGLLFEKHSHIIRA